MISRFYRSAAWPDPTDPPFVNAVVAITTELEPKALLEALHHIEDDFGRQRAKRNAPRTLDLDLLAYNDRVEEGDVTLPHPGIAARDFVLAPLCDIAPGWRHPVTGKTARQMLNGLETTTATPL